MSISVQNVSKKYDKQLALNNISFDINNCEVVGFLGPNGAGKSTMMKIITGYIPQSAGEVWVNGLNIQENPMDVRRQIGYLPEHNPLYLDMYVVEYLRHIASVYGLSNKSKRVTDVIELTGLGIEQHKKIGALSKGYRQRVGIAQALIHDPKVLILDEPTTGLDPNQLLDIRRLIQNIGKEKTVMLSTHIMQEVEACCQRALIVNRGELVADKKVEFLTADRDQVHIQLELDKAVDINLLQQISGVKSVENSTANSYKIIASEDIRKAIFQMAVQQNHILLEMKLVTPNLEDIFHQLTKEKI